MEYSDESNLRGNKISFGSQVNGDGGEATV